MLVGCLEFGEKGKNGSDSIDGGEGLKKEQVFCQEKRQFAGHEFDEDVQLYYCRARWYDSEMGRFITEDPARDGGNWFVYAANNPLVFVDFTGLEYMNGFDLSGTGPGTNTTASMQSQIMGATNSNAKVNIKTTKPILVNLPRKYVSPLDCMIFAPIDTLLQLTRPVSEPLMNSFPVTGAARNLAAASTGYDIFDGVITDTERVEKVVDSLGPLVDIASDIVISEFFNPTDVIDLFTDSYKDLKGNIPEGYQANHLNQDAAFREIIPKNEGVAVAMVGDAFKDIGSQHYDFHKSLEGFWEQYRTGSLKGKTPSIAEYNKALGKALTVAGFNSTEVKQLVGEARNNQLEYGLEEDMSIPRIPGRINQKKE